ncbi:hypothetical protein SCHPADRAFT_429979 [Schizopora paradoxa]|uniref:Secreted protein n=1 Tax=Schizopora paradoxa TaxID=27342 RepID=A0A0H2RKM5_9AGAM|nr:hypothetical protein SCHPADRAFT_429979 [Schizopora paradoxa]
MHTILLSFLHLYIIAAFFGSLPFSLRCRCNCYSKLSRCFFRFCFMRICTSSQLQLHLNFCCIITTLSFPFLHPVSKSPFLLPLPSSCLRCCVRGCRSERVVCVDG